MSFMDWYGSLSVSSRFGVIFVAVVAVLALIALLMS